MPEDADDATARLRNALVPFIGVELPGDFQNRFLNVIEPLQEAARVSDSSRRCNDRIVNVWEGMLAVHYHRNEVERIERETIDRVRAEFGERWLGPETHISIKMSTLGIANVAYLMAARSTLEYLAVAVAVCFGAQSSNIKDLPKTVKSCHPRELAEEVAEACEGLRSRFAHLLSDENRRKSPRDYAAHLGPINVPGLSVGLAADGIHATLDGREGQRLIDAMDRQITDLEHFVLELLRLAVNAERQLGCARRAQDP